MRSNFRGTLGRRATGEHTRSRSPSATEYTTTTLAVAGAGTRSMILERCLEIIRTGGDSLFDWRLGLAGCCCGRGPLHFLDNVIMIDLLCRHGIGLSQPSSHNPTRPRILARLFGNFRYRFMEPRQFHHDLQTLLHNFVSTTGVSSCRPVFQSTNTGPSSGPVCEWCMLYCG